MALLAEEIVEEWLNRAGWFTIRGIKLGVEEIDILALKPSPDKGILCRHVEVQASFNPVSYLTKIPKAKRKLGESASNARRRTESELQESVASWIHQKFDHPRKVAQRKALHNGEWSRELVVHNLRHPEEKEVIRSAGVVVHELATLIESFRQGNQIVPRAAGADFVELVTGFDLSKGDATIEE
ncbi:MAG TPA: hypothetical protein VGH19_03090 [Verrucomicrobiae bacterium]